MISIRKILEGFPNKTKLSFIIAIPLISAGIYFYNRVFISNNKIDTNIVESTIPTDSSDILGAEDVNRGKVESSITSAKPSPTTKAIDYLSPTFTSTPTQTPFPTLIPNTYYIYVTPTPAAILLPTSIPTPILTPANTPDLSYQLAQCLEDAKRIHGNEVASLAARGLYSSGMKEQADTDYVTRQQICHQQYGY